MPISPLRITVLMGGASAERDVSLASGLRIFEALAARGHVVIALDPAVGVLDGAALDELRRRKVGTEPPSLEALAGLSGGLRSDLASMPEVREADVVFLALHGGEGEDGTVQALLDMAGVRYTGSGHLASALAMDKDLSKILFRFAGVGTADWMMAPRSVDEVAQTLGWPVVVKPSKQGSTVGLTVVREPDALNDAITEAFRYDDEVMIERFIPGRELTVGVLGDVALPVGEIKPMKEIYDYECKYTAGMATEEFPANLSPEVTKQLQVQAQQAFAALKLRGYARIDFRLNDAGECYCLEANTLPGMTELSLIPQGAAAAGMSFGDLCERIVQLALG
ncbi:MAG: D-alanine--D-alanine ligase family protein [Gemmatimonadaceae bacterium]